MSQGRRFRPITRDEAQDALERLSIAPSDESFFKFLKAGDRQIVELCLDAGVPPDVCDTEGDAALVVATRNGQKEIARLLLARGASPEPLLLPPLSKKDKWDKLTATSSLLGFVSSLLIAGVGTYFTYTYNLRQIALSSAQATADNDAKVQANKILELDALQKLLPLFESKKPLEQKYALALIQGLTDTPEATRLGAVFQGQGSIDYLSQIAASTNAPKAKQAAVQALATIKASGNAADSEAASRVLGDVFGNLYKVADKAKISVVELAATTSRGPLTFSGVVVTNSGIILTTGNIAQDPLPDRITVTTWDGRTMAAQLLKFDRSTNLAIVQAGNAAALLPAQLSAAPIPVNADVIGIGYEFGSQGQFTFLGSVTSVDSQNFTTTDLHFPPNSAGGPLLGVNGEVVGVMNASLDGFSQAIPSNAALEFLKEAGIAR